MISCDKQISKFDKNMHSWLRCANGISGGVPRAAQEQRDQISTVGRRIGRYLGEGNVLVTSGLHLSSRLLNVSKVGYLAVLV
jgi:hypothetical protein